MTDAKTRMAPASTVSVDYRIVAGWHVFTSEQIKGLYVAHEDCRTAFESVAPTIEALVAENEHVQVEVKPRASFERFLDYLKTQTVDLPTEPGPRDFVVLAINK